MEQYEVFYRDILIGILTVDRSTGLHRYEPEEAGLSAVQGIILLDHDLRTGTPGFVRPIPFFQNRLKNMERFGLREINYQTDFFTIRRRG